MTVSLLVLCEDDYWAFYFEASMLSIGWHELWKITDKRVWVKCK